MNNITEITGEKNTPLRQIRSFVRRQGRLTQKQDQAILQHWLTFGLDYQPTRLDFQSCFNNQLPVVVEIGFGMGTSLVQMAKENPNCNYLGIEVHRPGVGACIAAALEADLKNLRVICHDAIDVLENMIPDQSLQTVQLFFPDPWQKIRHHKRRIINPVFIQLVRKKLQKEGVVHLATDWQNYANQMLNVMSQAEGYQNLAQDKSYVPRPASRPLTKFELRGQRLGHGVWDLMFKKVK